MELNGTLTRIKELLNKRSWSLYKLAKESGIPYSSLNSLFQKNHQPTIFTLEKICAGFHITMGDFFSENISPHVECYDITPDEQEIIRCIRKLNKRDRKLLSEFINLLMES